jgi:hypothetical protein
MHALYKFSAIDRYLLCCRLPQTQEALHTLSRRRRRRRRSLLFLLLLLLPHGVRGSAKRERGRRPPATQLRLNEQSGGVGSLVSNLTFSRPSSSPTTCNRELPNVVYDVIERPDVTQSHVDELRRRRFSGVFRVRGMRRVL